MVLRAKWTVSLLSVMIFHTLNINYICFVMDISGVTEWCYAIVDIEYKANDVKCISLRYILYTYMQQRLHVDQYTHMAVLGKLTPGGENKSLYIRPTCE